MQPFIENGKDGGKSEFTLRTKQFKISDKKKAMLKIRGLVQRQEIKELLEHIKKVNKKGEYVPFDIIFEYLENINKKSVSAGSSSSHSLDRGRNCEDSPFRGGVPLPDEM